MKRKMENCSPHGWTVDTLETFLSSKIEAIAKLLLEYEDRNKERFLSAERAVQSALLSSEKAIIKAESATEHRFDAVNEFRAQLTAQEKDLLGRPEYRAEHNALISRINKAEQAITELTTARDVSKATPIMIATITGVAINILMFVGLFLAFFLHLKNGG